MFEHYTANLIKKSNRKFSRKLTKLIKEMINNGCFCQHCGAVVDGEETGSPRNCIPCESDNPRWEGER